MDRELNLTSDWSLLEQLVTKQLVCTRAGNLARWFYALVL
jgi:hypothetical protein